MDVRGKLVEILLQEDDLCERGECKDCFANGSCYYYREADRLIANGITVQEWVSVNDRLPERPPDRVDEQGRSWFTPDIDCIVYDGENVFAAHYCFQNKCFWYSDTLHPLKNITHWVGMPQPPKGE